MFLDIIPVKDRGFWTLETSVASLKPTYMSSERNFGCLGDEKLPSYMGIIS